MAEIAAAQGPRKPGGISASDRYSVFLNIPYDERFTRLYLAYVAGIPAFGLTPRATLEIPGPNRRLNNIFDLIRTCRYSLHDLSRVQLDRKPPPTPRFNMPFELGLAVAWEAIKAHKPESYFVFEEVNRRLAKSLSDLNGTKVYIHGGEVRGVFRELASVQGTRGCGRRRRQEAHPLTTKTRGRIMTFARFWLPAPPPVLPAPAARQIKTVAQLRAGSRARPAGL